MRTLQRVGAGLFALTLFAGLAACGDDDGGGSDDTTADTEAVGDGEQAGADDAFCTSLVEFNSAVLASEIDDSSSEDDIVATGEELAPIFDEVATNAPEDLAAQADTLKGYIDPLLEGDAEAFNSDATFEEYTAFVSDAVDACGFETVAVTGVDYAFEGVPDTIAAGTVAFEFTNASESEEHEMLVIRKADGVAESFDEIVQMSEEESESLVEFKAAAFAPPGGSSGTLAELTPGDYAMICFIPVGGAEDGPPHFAEGMIHEFAVE
jgi:hypothetical protein